jgi:hypothetical protein
MFTNAHQYDSSGAILMGGLVNLIKNLFSGIFGFLGGLVGGKKASSGAQPKISKKKGKDGFFLEMDESAVEQAAAAIAKPVQSVVATVATTTAAVSEAVSDVVAESKSGKKPSRKEQLAALAKASEKPKLAESNGSVKTAPAKAEAQKPVAVAPAPAPAAPPETAFASKYLVSPSVAPRRRPGANMSSYLDMARTMK